MTDIDAVMDRLATAPGVVFDLHGYPNSNYKVLSHLLTRPDDSTWMSSLAVATRFPSGLHATAMTEPSSASGGVTATPLIASHTLAVLSSLAVATRFQSARGSASEPCILSKQPENP